MDAALTTGLGLDQPPEVRRKQRLKRKSGLRPSQASRIRLITLDHLDMRTNATQRAMALIAALEVEKGDITIGQRQLCQRAAILGAIAEDFETRYLAGSPIDLPDYLATVATQRRVLQALGLQRQGPKDVTPSLGSYLSERDPADSEGT